MRGQSRGLPFPHSGAVATVAIVKIIKAGMRIRASFEIYALKAPRNGMPYPIKAHLAPVGKSSHRLGVQLPRSATNSILVRNWSASAWQPAAAPAEGLLDHRSIFRRPEVTLRRSRV